MCKIKTNIIFNAFLITVFAISLTKVYATAINIESGAKFNINKSTINVEGDVNIAGTLVASSGTIIVMGDWTNSGTFNTGLGTVNFTAQGGTQKLTSGGTGAGKLFNNLIHSGSGTLLLSTNPVDIEGTFTNSTGTFNGNGLDMSVAGNFINLATFLHGNNTVVLDGTGQKLTGATTFFKLTKTTSIADTLTFDSTATQTIVNTLTLKGTSGNQLALRSDASPMPFKIALKSGGSQNLSFLDVKDSDATGGQQLSETSGNSVDSGNNTNWTFIAPPPPPPPSGGGGGGFVFPRIPTPTVTPTPMPIATPILPQSNSILGNVADTKGKPIHGALVEAFDFNSGDLVTGTTTDIFGNYIIANLLPGTYKIGVSIDPFVIQFFENADFDTATSVTVIAGGNTDNINFVIPLTNFISGNVNDNSGNPVSGIFVNAFDAITGDLLNDAVTDEQGNYSIIVQPGSYKIAVDPIGTDFLPEIFDNVSTFEDALVINVASDTNAENINFALSKGKLIKGRVTDADNKPIEEIFVHAISLDTGKLISSAVTDVNGEYCINVLPGTYKVAVEIFGTNFDPASLFNVTVNEGSDSSGNDFRLSISKSIKGKVSDIFGNPVQDMVVKAFDSTRGESVNFDITDINGNYSIPVIPGNYNVIVYVGGTNYEQISQFTSVTGSDIVINFALSQRSFILGRITDSLGDPVSKIIVDAFDFETGDWVNFGKTDINGDYSIPVPAGTYKVGPDTFSTGFASIFYEDADWDTATLVTVVEGEEVFNIDFTFTMPSFIAGGITDGTNPISNVLVNIFNFDTKTWVSLGETDEGGTYKIAIRPGTYKVGTFALEHGFDDKFFDDKDFDTADSVEILDDGQTESGIDFELVPGGSVSGIVTDGANPIEGIEVNAFTFNGDLFINSSLSDAQGNYTINGLPFGKYRIWAFDPDENRPEGRYNSEFFNNVTVRSQASPVLTVNGVDTPNIDFELSPGGSISGVVTDGNRVLSGILVEAYESDTGLWINSDKTDASGNYSVRLPNGQYRLRVFGPESNFASLYFDNASNFFEAKIVTVEDENDVTDINFALKSLTEENFISGKVVDDNNRPVKGIKIDVFDFETGSWLDFTFTDNGGKYKVSVPEGKYRVGITLLDSNFVPVFFDNAPGWSDATPVFVSSSHSAQNINFRLIVGGMVTGIVKDELDSPLSKIDVQVFNIDTNAWINNYITGIDGSFKITVPQGKYRVRATPLDVTSNLGSKFYDNIESMEFATLVTVKEREPIILNDIVLSLGNSISGRVKDDLDNAIAEVEIDVYEFSTGFWIRSDITDGDGQYRVKGLQPGDYRVKASPPPKDNLANRFFKDASNWEAAKRVKIASGDQDNIDFILPKGGYIAGKVIDGVTDRAISGVEVGVYDFNGGRFIDSDVTNGTGNYSVRVPVGTYLVRASTIGKSFIDMFFDNALDLSKANAVVVTKDRNANVIFKLKKGGKIKGVVQDEDNKPISGAKVNTFDFDTSIWVSNTVTDGDGKFTTNVPTGKYRLKVIAPIVSDFVDEFFNDVTDFDSGTVIEVAVSDETDVGQISLSKGRGAIKGTVKDDNGEPIEGIKVTVFKFDTVDEVRFAITNEKGEYKVSVPPGRYGVRTDSKVLEKTFIDIFFNNVTTSESATEININTGDKKLANFTLKKGACIKGRIIDAVSLTPLAGIEVHAFQSDTAIWVNSDKTDERGNYSICVPDGSYKVLSLSQDNKFGNQFYTNTMNFDKAKEINISDADKIGVNFDLSMR